MEDAGDNFAHEGRYSKALLGAENKPSKMEDDEWNDIDFCAKATIILCLSD